MMDKTDNPNNEEITEHFISGTKQNKYRGLSQLDKFNARYQSKK